jgi:hypothetical protein
MQAKGDIREDRARRFRFDRFNGPISVLHHRIFEAEHTGTIREVRVCVIVGQTSSQSRVVEPKRWTKADR